MGDTLRRVEALQEYVLNIEGIPFIVRERLSKDLDAILDRHPPAPDEITVVMPHKYAPDALREALQFLYDEIRSRFAKGPQGFEDMTVALRSVMWKARAALHPRSEENKR